jgi:hypothetical protein
MRCDKQRVWQPHWVAKMMMLVVVPQRYMYADDRQTSAPPDLDKTRDVLQPCPRAMWLALISQEGKLSPTLLVS